MVLHGFGKFVINRAMLDITRLVGLELNLLFVYSKCLFDLVQSQQVLTTLKDGTQMHMPQNCYLCVNCVLIL